MCYPSPETGKKKFSSPAAGKANMHGNCMVGVDTLQLHVASASVLQGGQTILRKKGKELWKGPLHYTLFLHLPKVRAKHCSWLGTCRKTAGSVLVPPMHYSQLTRAF